MFHFLMSKCPVTSNPAFMKAGNTQRVTGTVLALVVVLALLLLGHCFGYDVWQVPPEQPEQMWSKVGYDPKLTDKFFESDEWSCPDGCTECAICRNGKPVLKNTAKCYSTSFRVRHPVNFCEARLVDGNMIDLLIHQVTPACRDSLRVQTRKGKFKCQFWIVDGVGAFKWTTTRQELTLDKKAYRKGDVIKGRIDFQCLAQLINPKDIEIWGKDPTTTIKVYGVFKTNVK